MTRRMHRYEVPADNQPHSFELWGPVKHAAAVNEVTVEFWAEHWEGRDFIFHRRAYQVFGTGQPIPEDASYVGTCQRLPSGLVWHLYEVIP